MSFNKKFFTTGGIVASSGDAACSTDSVQAFGADNAFSSNIALYQLDSDGGITNNVPDTTTNYNGTASNVTYATGQFGNAAVFNGTAGASRSKITTSGLTTYNNFSISFWANPDDVNNARLIMGTSQVFSTTSGFGVFFGLTGNGNLTWRVSNGSSTVDIEKSSISTGSFYHIVITQNISNNEKKLYVNGVLEATSTSSINAIGQGYPLVFGGYNTETNTPYDGKLDQVRIFDKAISEEDVATLYAETSSTASNTNPFSEGSGVALYTMDYDASEASGNYDGTPTNVEFGVGGKINYGARFNGSSKIVVNKNVFTNTNVFSLSIWFKTDGTVSTTQFLMDSTGGASSGFQFYINNSKLNFFNRSGVTNSTVLTSTTSVDNSSWHNAVITQNSSGFATMYIDGQVEVASTNLVTVLPSHNLDLHIGGYYTSTLGLDGDIDQVRIFSKALSTDEVDTLYAETACIYDSTTDIVNYPSGTTPIAYYKMDNSAEDETGSYDGTESNIEYRFGRFSQAAVFNGSSSYIQTASNSVFASQTFTVSAWVNSNSNSANQVITSTYHGSGADRGWWFRLQGGKLALSGNTSGGNIAYLSPNSYSTNTWFHAVVVKTPTSIKLYENGQEVFNSSSTNFQFDSASLPLTIGRLGSLSTQYFNGKIDQVRIYSTALGADQVTELYEEKPEVDTSNFKTVLYEGNGSTNYISNVGFDLDVDNGGDGGLVWIKARETANSHALFDTVRGATNQLSSDLTAAEGSYSTVLSSFDANGFFVETSSIVNTNNDGYVAWVWKGGGDAVNIGVNTITGSTPSIASDVSANTEAGFSIVKYTGTLYSAGNVSVGHGLSQAPELIISKRLDLAGAWRIRPFFLNNNPYDYLEFDTGALAQFSASAGVMALPTSTTFDNNWNSALGGAGDVIAYCFHSVAGYSKIGSYQGNAGTKTIYTTDDDTSTGSGGFEPSFVMIKNIDDTTNSHWLILDNARSATNPRENELYPSIPNSEQDLNRQVNFVSNGFQLTSNSYTNRSGIDYIYMAFK